MENLEANLIQLIKSFSRFLKKNWREILAYGLILVAPFLVYVSGLTFDMTYFDDNDIIIDHLDLYRAKDSFHEIVFERDAFLENNDDRLFYFRPMQNASFWMDIRMAGESDPDLILHLHNLILFCLIGGLVYYLLRQVFGASQKLGLVLTLFFILNPLFVSLAVWIPARGDLLITFFGLISFLAFVKLTSLPHLGKLNQKILAVLTCWISFSLAFFSKETALIWPVIFLIYALFFNPKSIEKKAKKSLLALRQLLTPPFIILIILSLLTLIWWWLKRSALAPGQVELSWLALSTHWRAFPEFLANFFWPFGIKIVPLFNTFDTLLGLVILVILVWLAWFAPRNRHLSSKLFGLFWFVLFALPPLLSEFSSISEFVDYVNHRAFLPIIGILIFLTTLNFDPLKKLKEWPYWLIVGVLCGLLGTISYLDSQSYSGDIIFWELATQQSPNSAYGFYNLATVYQNHNKVSSSIESFTRAIELKKTDARFYNNRGLAYSYQKKYDLAVADYDQALKIDPQSVISYNNRALIKYRYLNDAEGAIQDLDLSLQLEPGDPMAWSLRALIKEELEDYQGSLSDIQAGLKLAPRSTELLNQLHNLQQKMSQKNQ